MFWANAISELYEQATSSQWVGARDIPWQELAPLDDEVERAVCQIMTFLAENEYAALYVPARFIGQIHPHFTEAALFLSTVMVDEARHIEVFTKRAFANGGGLGIASATTQLSLASLLEPRDFSTASFLLSVLGEGTFLDLLAFLEDFAPERATREICRRARQDETRRVRFGIAHAKYSIEADANAVAKVRVGGRGARGVPQVGERRRRPDPRIADHLFWGRNESFILASGNEASRRVVRDDAYKSSEAIGRRRIRYERCGSHVTTAHAEFHVGNR